MSVNKFKPFLVFLIFCIFFLFLQEYVQKKSSREIKDEYNIINDNIELSPKIKGYYQSYTKLVEFDSDDKKLYKCDGFLITEYSNTEGELLMNYFYDLIESGNTVNKTTENGKLIINLDLNDVDNLEKNILLQSYELKPVELKVRQKVQANRDAQPCESFVKVEEVLNSTQLPRGGVGKDGNPVSEYSIEGVQTYYGSGYERKTISADPKTLEVLKGSLQPMMGYSLSYEYAKDSNSIFFKGHSVEEASVLSFKPIENGKGIHYYGTDGKTVYFGYKSILGADPQTFKILWETIWEGCRKAMYSKDYKSVYYENILVPNADPETFEALINGFGKDKRGYYEGVEYIGASINPEKLVCNYG